MTGAWGAGSGQCAAPGCTNLTREWKTYCIKHIGMHDYVKDIIARQSAREAEVKSLNGCGKTTEGSILAQEILSALHVYGPRSAARLSRELNIGIESIYKVLRFMKNRGLITIGKTIRNTVFVELV